eukprot:m.58082 g.58082  ORF g.58082 m.58082 type:complete len:441 (-) comp12822_c0_seq1:58-1380(-)
MALNVVLAALAFASILASACAGAPPGPEKVFNDAGYIPVDNGRHNLFYWFFESRNDPANDPFLLWMSGGPGCSSQLALFGENGPYLIQEDLSLKLNPYSWNTNATVLWIDQPVGTGFSHGAPPIFNEAGMAKDMWEFLQGFFAKYPKYQKLPFHVVGESYAGHYVPALSSKIVEENAQQPKIPINYQGSAIGNGLTDPLVQFAYYTKYIEMYNHVTQLNIPEAELDVMKTLEPVCRTLTAGCNLANDTVVHTLECLTAYIACSYTQLVPVEVSGINLYDVREKCNPELPLCYNFSLIQDYLNQPAVQKALGTEGHSWQSCNRAVDLVMAFDGDWMVDFNTNVATVLEAGHRFLIYAGEYDFICNWLGNHAWTLQLEWPGHDAFNGAENKTWSVDGQVAGSSISAQGFTFLKVRNAGHMVPRDQPKNSLDMINRHLFNTPF